MGPPGDCPCIRKQRGQPVPITEAYVSSDAWNYLTDEEKTIINELKLTAALRSIFSKQPEASNVHTPPAE
jgi:hypothetical protein